MIFYFSATGNSKHVAKRLAEELDEELINIEEINYDEPFDLVLEEGEKVGIVAPTYACRMPEIVETFINNMNLPDHSFYSFYVSTYGQSQGQHAQIANKMMSKKGQGFFSLFDVRLPDTYVPFFDVTDTDKNKQICLEAEGRIDEIIKIIKEEKIGDYTKKAPIPFASFTTNAFYNKIRKTKHLSADEKCIGCSKCAKNCPVGVIEMKDNKPHWMVEECQMCLRCLHNCPTCAIEYDHKTRDKGQYVYKEK